MSDGTFCGTDLSMIATCALPGCWATYEQSVGRGRPRRYCCDEHRREADTMRKRCEARIARMRELIRRDEHLLAALGEPTAAAWDEGWRAAHQVLELDGQKVWAHAVLPEGYEGNPYRHQSVTDA